ncbi:hypothetical protein JOD24_001408 [Kroppenstedtia sanguinis]
MINQKMGSGRESCATKATFVPQALQFEVKDAPQALQSKGAEALDEGCATGTTIQRC